MSLTEPDLWIAHIRLLSKIHVPGDSVYLPAYTVYATGPVPAEAKVAFLQEPRVQQVSQTRKLTARLPPSSFRYKGQFCRRRRFHLSVWPSPPHPFASYCQPLRVSTRPHRALPRLHLYYGLVRLPYRHTPSLPLQLVGSFRGERHGSPKFRCVPSDVLPWTQTPARHGTLAHSACRDTGFQEMEPLALCEDGNFGARYLHLRYGRPSPSLRLRMVRCLPIRGVPFWPGG